MAVVTAVRSRRGRIAVELDGQPWRTLPFAVVAEARLTVGVELDRRCAREVGRALRRHRANDAALRAIARRDHSRATLAERLERVAGVRPADRNEALETVTRIGLVDDARFAAGRARALADRGAGDLLVVDDLARRGIGEEEVRTALASVEPEAERLARIVAARGASLRTLRYLASKGFSEEALEGLVADLENGALG